VLGIDRRLRPARPLRAFVGHRFTPGVTNNLRHNLQLLCRPYGVSLWYSDTDMPNGSVFETIVQRIRQSDFCVFDDRETEVRPNVLIELGVAIGTGKPYFYLNYQKKRKVAIARRKEVITTASDLAGMLYMPYTSYEDVCLELAMRLPGFLGCLTEMGMTPQSSLWGGNSARSRLSRRPEPAKSRLRPRLAALQLGFFPNRLSTRVPHRSEPHARILIESRIATGDSARTDIPYGQPSSTRPAGSGIRGGRQSKQYTAGLPGRLAGLSRVVRGPSIRAFASGAGSGRPIPYRPRGDT